MIQKRLGTVLLTCLALAGCGEPTAEDIESITSPIVRGTVENGRNYVMELRIQYGNGRVGLCSGVLYAPRVVLTAAHCIDLLTAAQVKVSEAISIIAYIGNNFDADFAALGSNPQAAIPAPPTPSRFMLADSFEKHPSWNPATLFADLAVVYLDRQPRIPPNTIVDPLPVGRTRLGASTVGQLMTLVGYGGLRALTEDISQVEGARIKRTGTAPFVGQPITSPLPPHPHPGLGVPAVLNSLFQTNGTAPNANGCAGDSGGPAIRNIGGQDQILGIGTWTGDFCENFSYFTRLDPFLPFIDASYTKGGQGQLAPRLECVGTRPTGGLRAYFGYNNQNGVVMNVPYGANNSFAQDTTNLRPTSFGPGNHLFRFGINFTAGQTLSYRLVAPSGPNTLLTVNQNSPRCNVNSRPFICAQACDPGVALPCGTLEACVSFCLQSYQDFAGCETQFDAVNRCQANVPSSGFICDPDFGPFDVSGTCDPQFNTLFTCLTGG